MGRQGDLEAADKAEHEELPPLFAYLEGVITEQAAFWSRTALPWPTSPSAPPLSISGTLRVAAHPAAYPKLHAYVGALLARPSFAPLIARERRYREKFAA